LITLGPIPEPRQFEFDGVPPVLVVPVEGGTRLRVSGRQHAE
jgi:hypothetical protein